MAQERQPGDSCAHGSTESCEQLLHIRIELISESTSETRHHYTFMCRTQEYILGAHMSGKAEIDSPSVISCPLEAELGDWLHASKTPFP